MTRRRVMAIVGNGGEVSEVIATLARELGREAVARGFRVVTGGLGGVMAAASEGARTSEHYTEGSVVGVLPGYDRREANPWVDLVIPTGMQVARNVLVVAMADVVVAVGGGSGTLSEMALAWQLGRPIVALMGGQGWADELGGRVLDHRHAEPVAIARDAAEAVEIASRLASESRHEAGNIGLGWRRGAT